MKMMKTIGIVVGVVALVATGVGLALGGAAAGAAAAGGAAALGATLMTIGAIASVASGLIGLATAVFAPKPGFSGGGNPLQFQTNPQSGLPYAIGRTRMSGLRIHADTYDGTSYKSEGKQDILSFAVLLNAVRSHNIETFRADKELVSFHPTTGMGQDAFANWTAMKVSLGLAGASALALAFGGGNFPGWTADHKLSDMTHALWDLRGDEKGEHFGAGVPEPEWVGQWALIYDPREDDTYPGGSGDCRALDEETYVWSNNPYLHALTWCLGRWANGKKKLGIGAPVENIRVADFVEGANVAEANGWACGGVEWSTDPKWTTLKRMLQAGGGEPTMTGAMIGCRVNTPRVSVATITADKLLDGLSVATTRSRRDRFNTVIPRYRSEDHDWEVISGSPVTHSLWATEDGGQRTKEIDFPLVQHEGVLDGNEQAGQLAAYEIVNSREAGPIRFTGGPEYVGIKTGDCVVLDVPDEGLDAQKVLIRKKTPDATTFKFTFEAETETDAKHDFALGKTTTPPSIYSPTPPDLTPPTPDDALWTLTAELTGDSLPAIRVAGVCEFPGADLVVVEYRKVGDPNWSSAGAFEASTPVDTIITTVEELTDYEARISYRSGIRSGGWLTLDEVTTPANPLLAMLVDFNASNNRNDAAIPFATWAADGSAIFHVNNNNGSVDYGAQWGWSGDPADVDGAEGVLVGRASASAYTIGSDPTIEDHFRLPPDVLAFGSKGVNPTANYTAYIRYYRRVDADVWAVWAAANPSLASTTVEGLIVSAWSKSTTSGENPYKPETQPAYSGNIEGVASTLVVVATDRALNAIRSDYTISPGGVVTDSIDTDAINNAGYGTLGSMVFLSASDNYDQLLFGTSFDVQGDLVVECIVPVALTVVNPNAGDKFSVTFNTLHKRTGAGGTTAGPDVTLEERWDGASAVGSFTLAKRNVSFKWRFTGLTPGTFEIGVHADTPSTNGAALQTDRFIKGEDMRAIK